MERIRESLVAEVTTWRQSDPTIRRPGQPQLLVFTPWFRAKQGAGDTKDLARSVPAEAQDSYPRAFLIVGLTVLFLLVENRNAWLLPLPYRREQYTSLWF